jgi:hypothetical protein
MVAKLSNRDLICTVYKRSPPRMRQHPARRFEGPNYSAKAFVVAFANVDCWIYATGGARANLASSLRKTFHGFGATEQTAGHY